MAFALRRRQARVWVGHLAHNLKRAPLLPLCLIVVLALIAILANVIALHSPVTTSLPNRLIPPFWMEGGILDYPLGTDEVGRDVLSRVFYGARISLSVAALALLLGAGIGTTIGLVSGYFGGKTDAILMRAADTTMAFPIILLALLLAVTKGPSFQNVVVAIGLVIWTRFARVIRGEVLSLRESDFVAQAKIAGCSHFRILLRHIFPNVINTLMVLVSLQVGWVIILEATLSFLGAGVPPPTATWGSMIVSGREYVTTAWWVLAFPGLAIALTVIAFNMVGDWLRDTIDPKLRQV